jgi:hypothetical protein
MSIYTRLCAKSQQALRAATLVTLAIFAVPAAAGAETAGRLYKVGFLGQTSAEDHARQTRALRQGLRDLGSRRRQESPD